VNEPRIAVIEGIRALVTQRTPPIAPTLELMLNGGRDVRQRPWKPLRVVTRSLLHIAGIPSASCMASSHGSVNDDHRLRNWLGGFVDCSDGVTRYVVLQACTDCGAVCVRDRSFDSLDGLPHGGRPLRRRDHIIGWYTGNRPAGRVYT
jgi:hypothetical protein